MTDPTCPADRIDAHYHLWQLSVRDQPWTAGLPGLRRDFTLGELRPQLAEAGMRAGVLVQTVPVAEETPEMLTAADSADEIAGVVAGPILALPTSPTGSLRLPRVPAAAGWPVSGRGSRTSMTQTG